MDYRSQASIRLISLPLWLDPITRISVDKTKDMLTLNFFLCCDCMFLWITFSILSCDSVVIMPLVRIRKRLCVGLKCLLWLPQTQHKISVVFYKARRGFLCHKHRWTLSLEVFFKKEYPVVSHFSSCRDWPASLVACNSATIPSTSWYECQVVYVYNNVDMIWQLS